MAAYSLTLCTIFILFSFASCKDALVLTDENFNNVIKEKEIALVEFFAPWCGHCKKLAPEYENAASQLIKNDPPVPLVQVDCDGDGKDTCKKHGVSGYPTLKIFRNGAFSQEYDGPRDANGIVAYMKKNAGPSSVVLRDVEHLKQKLDTAEDITVVGFFSKENALFKKFQRAADLKRSEYNFAHSTDATINAEFGHTDETVFFRAKHMHAKFEDSKVIVPTDSDIALFIGENYAGLVGQIKPNTEEKFKKPLIVVYYNVDWKKNNKGSRYWRNRVARVAKKFDDINFAIAAKSDFTRQLTDMLIDEYSDHPVAVAFDDDSKKYKMADEDFNVDNLEKFCIEFKNHELKPYVKSEALPENNDGPVKTVVGENFDEIVNDASKDVLIEFYAPWCGHCKSLEPKYTELGERLAEVNDITIAKMDATANDVPSPYAVSGFPTIYWAPAGNKKQPKKYEGSREVDGFLEFIKKESTNPFELPKKKKKKKKKSEL